MASAPWYLNSDQPSLKHQKNWKDKVGSSLVKGGGLLLTAGCHS